MGDVGDTYRAMKQIDQEKRAANRWNSAAMLEEAGIPFVSKNGGAHLIVESATGLIDFWPGTGLWVTRTSHLRRTGVVNLISFIKPTE